MESTATAVPTPVPGRKRSQQYPPPLIIDALQEHRQSFIILHGRGSNADTFGPALLQTSLPNGQTFQAALPHAKFIFPTASFRRATAYGRIPITQWFDNHSLDDPCQRQHLQIEGLRESAQFVHSLIRQEAQQVGYENVVLGGLSQGCATILISLLLWTGPPLPIAFGMSGWLPFNFLLVAKNQENTPGMGDPDHVVFESTMESASSETGNADHQGQTHNHSLQGTIKVLREELELVNDNEPVSIVQTAIFVGHGVDDEKVPVRLGKQAATTLTEIGCDVSLHTYEHLGHWYHGAELADLIDFIKRNSQKD